MSNNAPDEKLPGQPPEEADDSPAEKELRESHVIESDESDDDDTEPGLTTYATSIVTIEQQIGAHVIRALSHEGAAGVLTVAQPGPTGQRLVSIPLDGHMFGAIQKLIAQNQAAQRPREVPCIGFHCRYEVPQADAGNGAADEASDSDSQT